MTSLLETYLSTVQKQDLTTKYLQNKRPGDSAKTPVSNKKCRFCSTKIQDKSYIISVCFNMSAIYYFPLRHDEVTKTKLNSHHKTFYPFKRITLSSELEEYICKENTREYWWNMSVKTATKVPHNKPDLIIWGQKAKICNIEFSCSLDINIKRFYIIVKS